MGDVLINVEIEAYRVGKRAKKMNPHQFIVSEQVFDYLVENKRVDLFDNKFTIDKTKEFVEGLDKLCFSVSELDLLNDIKKKVYPFDYIHIERVIVRNRFYKIVKRIEGDYAVFKSNEGNEFSVKLSDRAKYEKIKENDEVEITVLVNKDWLVTRVSKSYNSLEAKKELEKQMAEFEDLIGGY